MQETELRRIIKVSGVPQWRIAEQIGVSPNTLCIWTRSTTTLTKEREKKIRKALKELKIKAEE